jgi:hypothetical protein
MQCPCPGKEHNRKMEGSLLKALSKLHFSRKMFSSANMVPDVAVAVRFFKSLPLPPTAPDTLILSPLCIFTWIKSSDPRKTESRDYSTL